MIDPDLRSTAGHIKIWREEEMVEEKRRLSRRVRRRYGRGEEIIEESETKIWSRRGDGRGEEEMVEEKRRLSRRMRRRYDRGEEIIEESERTR